MVLRHSSSLALLVFVGLVSTRRPPRGAAANPCPPDGTFAVSVSPKGTAVTLQTNTSGHTATFTVQNTGTCPDTYAFSYTATGPISGVSLDKSSAFLAANGGQTTVTATYTVGAAGTGELDLAARGNTGGATDAGWYNVTAAPPSVSVASDGSAIEAAAGANKSVAFTVTNTGPNSDTYTLACAVTGSGTCVSVSRSSASLNPGQSVPDTVTVTPGPGGTRDSGTMSAPGFGSVLRYRWRETPLTPSKQMARCQPIFSRRRGAEPREGGRTHRP